MLVPPGVVGGQAVPVCAHSTCTTRSNNTQHQLYRLFRGSNASCTYCFGLAGCVLCCVLLCALAGPSWPAIEISFN